MFLFLNIKTAYRGDILIFISCVLLSRRNFSDLFAHRGSMLPYLNLAQEYLKGVREVEMFISCFRFELLPEVLFRGRLPAIVHTIAVELWSTVFQGKDSEEVTSFISSV